MNAVLDINITKANNSKLDTISLENIPLDVCLQTICWWQNTAMGFGKMWRLDHTSH